MSVRRWFRVLLNVHAVDTCYALRIGALRVVHCGGVFGLEVCVLRIGACDLLRVLTRVALMVAC